MKSLRAVSATLLVLLFAMPCSWAADERPVMNFIFQRDSGDVNDYAWMVLREALERTRGRFGDYTLEPSPAMSDRPRYLALANQELGINVNVFPDSANVGDDVLPVSIPVDRGMLGYRVLLIHASDQIRFAEVKSLADLGSFRFGILSTWIDAPVMRDAGLPVIAGRSYEGLFKMLVTGRFDALNRSVTEVTREYQKFRSQMPDVVIERALLLHYPIPSYFWLPNSPEGRRRVERISAGLESMVEDGTLQAYFDKEFGPLIAELDLAHRRVIEIPNDTLRLKGPLKDPRFWYRPIALAAN